MTFEAAASALIALLVIVSIGLLALLFHWQRRERQLQEQLENIASRLEHSEAEHRDFVYIVSHDLMEPVRAIDMFTGLVETRHSEAIDDEAKEFISYIHQSSGQLNRMIMGLLEYSRVGTESLSAETVSLESAVSDAMSSVQNEASWNAARVEHASLPVVYADRRRLTQLLEHLIRNACLYSRAGQTPEILIEGQVRETDWLISVTDNGIGIEREYLHRVFRPFARLDRSTGEGVGMGLAVCRRIVSLHGGEIRAESAQGTGTSVIFSLPRPTSGAPSIGD